MTPNEKSCFYAWVEEKGVKVAFYFAVRVRCALGAGAARTARAAAGGTSLTFLPWKRCKQEAPSILTTV